MNRERLIIFSVLTLVFVGVSLLYFSRVWNDAHTRFRTGLPVPSSLLPKELQNPDDVIPDGPPTLPMLRATDPMLSGAASSSVTIVMFGDFQCPSCKDQAQSLDDALLLASAQRSVRTIWRDMPLVNQHPRAMAAAVAAQCAGKQGKFKQMHDALFYRGTDLSDAEILRFASDIGLSSQDFLVCERDPAVTFQLQKDLTDATHHAIKQVPTLFVDGTPIEGYIDAQTLAAVIKRQLERH
jgi:protein-disulfide isomerase